MFDKKIQSGIIFVGGIHGVGKSTLCNQIAMKYNIKYYTCSSIIFKYTNLKKSNDKIVKDINKNQDILLKAANEIINGDKVCLLDGHFCLINNKKCIEKVQISVFSELKIKAVVVLIDKPINIAKKIYSRDGKRYSIDYIQRFQRQEIEQARKVSKELKIPYKEIKVWKNNIDNIKDQEK